MLRVSLIGRVEIGLFTESLPEEYILEWLFIARNTLCKLGQSLVIRKEAYYYFEGINNVLVHLTSLVFPRGIWLKNRGC